MKLATIIPFLAISGYASPIVDSRTGYVSSASIQEYTSSATDGTQDGLQTLERRINVQQCKRVLKTLWSVAGNVAVAELVYSGIDLYQEMCEGKDDPDCGRHAEYVRKGLRIMFNFIGLIQVGTVAAGPNGVEQNTNTGTARRSLESGLSGVDFDLGDLINSRFQSHGLSFDRLEPVDISHLSIDKRGSGPHLAHRYVMRNFRDSHHRDDADATIDHYDNDSFDLHVTRSSTGNSTQSNLSKRYDGEGIKLNWKTEDVENNLDTIDEGEVYQFSEQVANDWRLRVVNDGISQYFGLIKSNKVAEAYFRIIGETNGFGNDYEDVNACGDLSEFVVN